MTENNKYNLVYFNLRGLAEVSRYILNIAGVDFKDSRYDIHINNGEYSKPEFDKDNANNLLVKSMGKVPYLEVTQTDGEIITICQSKINLKQLYC